jgi:hypothetical protein
MSITPIHAPGARFEVLSFHFTFWVISLHFWMAVPRAMAGEMIALHAAETSCHVTSKALDWLE